VKCNPTTSKPGLAWSPKPLHRLILIHEGMSGVVAHTWEVEGLHFPDGNKMGV
jgi:hypothetical protein